MSRFLAKNSIMKIALQSEMCILHFPLYPDEDSVDHV